MISRPLHICRSTQPLRPVQGWLIQGGDAQAWLDEIARWKIKDAECAIYMLPRSGEDLAAGAALVLCAEKPATPPAAAPYASIAGKAYLPVDAVLLPVTTEAELLERCGTGVLIFHPTLGAVYAERRLTVAELVRGGQELDEPFAHVPEFRQPHGRIEAVTFRFESGIEDLMQEMRGDIGTEPETELPPAEDEPKDGPVERGKRRLRKAALDAASWLFNSKGAAGGKAGAEGSGMFGKIENWINRRMEALSSEVEKMRNKSIHRLLEQLNKDPDEALKHAIPLAPSGLNRGTAPPGGQLGTHTPNFNLEQLRGGKPSDDWNLDQQVREQLRQNYLRLAERERQLGRYRRAAYVYAKLLGDLTSAAAVLKEGKQWREAALIYRDHLGQRTAAAECFVEARMLREAVEIYEQDKAFERLGRLYRKLGDEARAQRAFRQWVEALIQGKLLEEAAKVLLDDLGEREESLSVLESAWPSSWEAIACLERWFVLRAEAGEHARARAFVEKIGATRAPELVVTTAIEVLARIQHIYPDRGLRALADDTGRKFISGVLQDGYEEERRQIAKLLPSLCPEDRLLARDAMRYASLQAPQRKQIPVVHQRPGPPAAPGEVTICLIHLGQFPGVQSKWHSAVAANERIYAVWSGLNCTVAASATFLGVNGVCEWITPSLTEFDTPMLLCPPVDGFPNVLVYHPTAHLRVQSLGDIRAGAPSWLSGPVYAAAIGNSVLWLLRHTPTGLTLSGHHRDGTLVNQLPIAPIFLEENPDWQESMAGVLPSLIAFGKELAVAIADRVIVYLSAAADTTATTVFDGPILKLIPGPRWAKPHFAVVFRDRVEICWVEGSRLIAHSAREMIENPVAGFTTDGTLIILSGGTGYFIESDSRGQQKCGRCTWSGTAPVAILPGPYAQSFCVVETSGRMTVWRFNRRDLR